MQSESATRFLEDNKRFAREAKVLVLLFSLCVRLRVLTVIVQEQEDMVSSLNAQHRTDRLEELRAMTSMAREQEAFLQANRDVLVSEQQKAFEQNIKTARALQEEEARLQVDLKKDKTRHEQFELAV